MPSISSNLSAFFAQNNLRSAESNLDRSISALSSGNRIVRASDDVAALSVGTILRTDVSTLRTALTSTNQGATVLNLADGALSNVGEILQRQKSLAVSSNSGTLTDTERGFLNQEFQSLKDEIDRIVTNTNFNGIVLLDGSVSGFSNTTAQAPAATGNFIEVGAAGSAALDGTSTAAVSAAVASSLVGSLANAEVSVSGTGSDDIVVDIVINGTVYTSGTLDVSTGTSAFAVVDGITGATITIGTLQQHAGTGADVATAANRQTVADAIKADIAGITIYQQRALETDTSTTTFFDTTKVENTILSGLDGDSFTLQDDRFDPATGTTPAITNFRVTKEDTVTDGKISVSIGGEVFETAVNAFGANATDISGIGNLTLTSVANSNRTLVIALGDLTSSTAAIDTANAASVLESSLNAAFAGSGAGGLDFQVGVNATDLISISINAISTSSLYVDAAGTPQTLSIATASDAVTASGILDNAIQSLTTERANVGALQSRFNFAGAVLETSIANVDAARASFLDADISEEATNFATSQVLVQASISVLAQANQLPQNLLKLIG